MIAQLTGLFVRGTENHLIINVQGVGYLVWATRPTIERAMVASGPLTLEILTLFKQDDIVLYGFDQEIDKNIFELLLNVQGVGGKMALALISALGTTAILSAIQHQDHTPLTQASGVGPKLAQRITRELKDKVSKLSSLPIYTEVGSTDPKTAAYVDAQHALIALGYKSHQVNQILKKIADQNTDLTIDQVITLALKHLSQLG